jgi:hypothetical protein
MEDTNSLNVVLRLGFDISVDEVIETLEGDMSEILESAQKVTVVRCNFMCRETKE